MNRAVSPAATGTRPRSTRKQLFTLHAWVGFHLAAVMALVLATGTFATIANEIDWLLQHDMRVDPDGARVSWGDMAEAVRAHRPDATLVSLQELGGDHFAFRARMVDEHGRQTFVHVDPWTGEVTGETHPLTVQRFLRDLHRYLFLPNYLGIHVVCSLAFVLAISLYTGLKTARNWRTLLFRVRTDRGTRVFLGDLHKSAGLWASWFFVVMIATGVWYLVEFEAAVAGARFEPPRPGLTAERAEALGPVIRDAGTDAYLRTAARVFPELRPTQILYPTRARDSVNVLGVLGNPLLRERANRVFIDPVSLEVLKVQREDQISWAAWLNETADPLHFGYFGGLPTKLLWFGAGIAMTGLSLTGVWLTWRRLRSTTPSRAQWATAPVLLLSAFFFVGWLERYVGTEVPRAERILAAETLPEGGRAELRAVLSERTGTPTGLLRVVARAGSPDDRIALQRATLTLGDEVLEARGRDTGPVTALRLDVPRDRVRAGATLHAVLAFNGGRTLELEGRYTEDVRP